MYHKLTYHKASVYKEVLACVFTAHHCDMVSRVCVHCVGVYVAGCKDGYVFVCMFMNEWLVVLMWVSCLVTMSLFSGSVSIPARSICWFQPL